MKQRWRSAVLLLGSAYILWLLLDSSDVRGAVLEGLRLCVFSVIPALFPFLVMSSLLILLGLGERLSGPLSGLMSLFGIGGAGSSALILGLVGGYPVGARTAAELYREHLLSRDEVERLLTFCNNSNPAFLINLLGVGVFHSLRAGVWLWIIHILAVLLTGLTLGRHSAKKVTRSSVPRAQRSRSVCFPDALVSAVHSALNGILGICAFVVFFYVLAIPLRGISGPAGTALVGITELFSAIPRLTPDIPGLILASGLAGFGGVSVLCQTLSVLSGSGLSAAGCLKGKLLQGLLAAALAAALAGYIL